jgi:hypothetical protein
VKTYVTEEIYANRPISEFTTVRGSLHTYAHALLQRNVKSFPMRRIERPLGLTDRLLSFIEAPAGQMSTFDANTEHRTARIQHHRQ